MRPYRGLTKEGKWVYGWYLQTRLLGEHIHWIIKNGLYATDIIIGIDNTKFPKMLQGCYQVIPKTVGQSTGKFDNKRTKEYPKGQEIYEGDIDKSSKGVVVYNQDDCSFICDAPDEAHCLYDTEKWFEVIGNQTQNPKLLKEND